MGTITEASGGNFERLLNRLESIDMVTGVDVYTISRQAHVPAAIETMIIISTHPFVPLL